MDPAATAVMITGTVGVGKSTTAAAIDELLTQQGIPHAVIDTDDIRRSWPTPPDDPFNGRLELRNLGDLARNFRTAGAERLVVAGVIESSDARGGLTAALGSPLVICRLTLDLDTIRARLRVRHADAPAVRDWHVHRTGELAEVYARAEVADHLVAVGTATPAEVAARVLAAVGWDTRTS